MRDTTFQPTVTPEAIEAGLRAGRRLRAQAVLDGFSAIAAALRGLLRRPAGALTIPPQPLPLRRAL